MQNFLSDATKALSYVDLKMLNTFMLLVVFMDVCSPFQVLFTPGTFESCTNQTVPSDHIPPIVRKLALLSNWSPMNGSLYNLEVMLERMETFYQ